MQSKQQQYIFPLFKQLVRRHMYIVEQYMEGHCFKSSNIPAEGGQIFLNVVTAL